MKNILIAGITGQDGLYLTKQLLESQENYNIYGVTREKNSLFFDRLKTITNNETKNIFLNEVSLMNSKEVSQFVLDVEPDYVVNLSGPSSVYNSFRNKNDSFQIEEIFKNLFKSLQKLKKFPNFFQASSSEMYGNNEKIHQNETGPFNPISPYAVSKYKIHNSIQNYTNTLEGNVVSGIMFNHESKFRGNNFLFKKISKYAKNHKKGTSKLKLGSLDYVRDWSFAEDICEGIYELLISDKRGSYVLGSGEGTSIKYVVEKIFSVYGLDWEDRVTVDTSLLRTGDPENIISNPKKIFSKLNWKTKHKIDQTIEKCIEI